MKPAIQNIKGRPVIGQFLTYMFKSNGKRGEVVEVDFKVKGKQIEYKYTKLKPRLS